jgi:hypothetical protein
MAATPTLTLAVLADPRPHHLNGTVAWTDTGQRHHLPAHSAVRTLAELHAPASALTGLRQHHHSRQPADVSQLHSSRSGIGAAGQHTARHAKTVVTVRVDQVRP